MARQLKVWTALGASALVAHPAVAADVAVQARQVLNVGAWAQVPVGEGGEGGGEAGTQISQYRLLLDEASDPVYDAAPVVQAYAAEVQRAYQRSRDSAIVLRGAIRELLASPDAAHLAAAREQWIAARRFYLLTEAFRYYDGPIDQAATDTRAEGPEARLNAWPLNEAVIDYVEGDAKAGLVNALDVPITRDSILERDQVTDEADVTTGWHAIEFLLWGQDLSATGPGDRPASDFAPGDAVRERRRLYLATLADQVIDDLDMLARDWDPSRVDSYATRFLALEPHEAIGRMVTGIAYLTGYEMASERLAVSLDSGMQEDEHSCFSDTTWQDFVWDLAGIKRVYYGVDNGPSLAKLVERLQPNLALDMERRFADAERRLAAIEDPFDRMLAAAPGSAEREAAEAAVTSLQQLAAGLRDTGRALGVLVIVPGV
jgi:putative iron-regulated protein